MAQPVKPLIRPENANFSSGPCAKRPGWSTSVLEKACLGRSHRSTFSRARIKEVIDLSHELLLLPADYLIGIMPASDTGAIEAALWSILGIRGIDLLAWESFGASWAADVVQQLKLPNTNIHRADYGFIPDLKAVNFNNDVVFTWNGTTSGVCVPNGDWIPDKREGLTICDATSAVFATEIPWKKIDVATYSWQKALGGEAAHGMLILSPRAVQRLESHKPSWPLPKIFRLTEGNKLNRSIFAGWTINTPSMLCIEDILDALKWVQSIGGLSALVKRSRLNREVLEDWVRKTSWIDFLVLDPKIRSSTSVCLKIVDPWFESLAIEAQRDVAKEIVRLVEDEEIAYDINAYRDAPPGLRIWCGATINSNDLKKLTPWLDWAFSQVNPRNGG